MHRTPAPQNRRAAITSDELRDLYLTQRLTIEQVGVKLGVASTTISRRMRDLGIDARRRGPRPGTRDGEESPGASGFEWSPELAYAVGLIATDGCLGRDESHLTMTSKDTDLLETFGRCLGMKARITRTASPRPCYRIQWCDSGFHRWLTGIGLMPAKSLRLAALRVPDEWFRDFLRGCIDGDGSVITYTDRYNTLKKSQYVYTRVYLSLVSASPPFIQWIRATLQRLVAVRGDIGIRRSENHHDTWRLRYAKREALVLLRWMYYSPKVPCLGRKREIAAPFLTPTLPPLQRRPGRPMVV